MQTHSTWKNMGILELKLAKDYGLHSASVQVELRLAELSLLACCGNCSNCNLPRPCGMLQCQRPLQSGLICVQAS